MTWIEHERNEHDVLRAEVDEAGNRTGTYRYEFTGHTSRLAEERAQARKVLYKSRRNAFLTGVGGGAVGAAIALGLQYFA
jgi:hypothetical protein